jgi:hypothetical protein
VPVFGQAPVLGGCGVSKVSLNSNLPPHSTGNNQVFTVKSAGAQCRSRVHRRLGRLGPLGNAVPHSTQARKQE